jgi:hypothetical protein
MLWQGRETTMTAIEHTAYGRKKTVSLCLFLATTTSDIDGASAAVIRV